MRAGSSKACPALGLKLSPAGCWFYLLCCQRILAMSSWTFRFSVFLQPEFFQADIFFLLPLWGMRGCSELSGEAERAQILDFQKFPAGPWGHKMLWWMFRWNPAVFCGWQWMGQSRGIWFQDILVCCSCGVMKSHRNADRLMTWKTSFHNENVRVWRPAWWFGKSLVVFFHWLWGCWNFWAFLCSILWHFMYLA